MNKEEAKAKADKLLEQEAEKPFNPRSLVGKNKTQLAIAYGVSTRAFTKSIAPIEHLLEAERQKVRPDCKRGAQGYTLAMVLLVVGHLGMPRLWASS